MKRPDSAECPGRRAEGQVSPRTGRSRRLRPGKDTVVKGLRNVPCSSHQPRKGTRTLKEGGRVPGVLAQPTNP